MDVELTNRESRIAELVVAGRTNEEAARELGLSVKTVEAHLSRVYRKLRVRSRSQLVALVVRSEGKPVGRADGEVGPVGGLKSSPPPVSDARRDRGAPPLEEGGSS